MMWWERCTSRVECNTGQEEAYAQYELTEVVQHQVKRSSSGACEVSSLHGLAMGLAEEHEMGRKWKDSDLTQ